MPIQTRPKDSLTRFDAQLWSTALLADLDRECPRPVEPNPYQQSFTRFLRDCIWTIDEARAGEVRRWPSGPGWDELWQEVEDAFLSSKLLMVEKARRVLASWACCAFDVWLAAGGCDEQGRWPELSRSSANRQIILAARKAEGHAGAEWFIASRIRSILDNFERLGGREKWPDFPTWSFATGQITFSNGSKITGVPQGSDQLRGAAATLLHFEELAFWEQARPSITGALPTLLGGGHLIAITTPQVGSFAAQIRNGEVTRRGR